MSSETVAIVVGSITGISLVGFLLNKYYQKNDIQKYNYTNRPELLDEPGNYSPNFGVGGKKNKTKRKRINK
jgi:hypothetical protein